MKRWEFFAVAGLVLLAGCTPYQVGQWNLTSLTNADERGATVESAQGLLRISEDTYADLKLTWRAEGLRDDEPREHRLEGKGLAQERFEAYHVELAGEFAEHHYDENTAAVSMECTRRDPKGLSCRADVLTMTPSTDDTDDEDWYGVDPEPLEFTLNLEFELK